MEHSQSLPYASSLCGACYEVCPVKINIPEILIHLRRRIVERASAPLGERARDESRGARVLRAPDRLEAGAAARRASRSGRSRATAGSSICRRPLARAGPDTRDLPAMPAQSFREWWARREDETPRR